MIKNIKVKGNNNQISLEGNINNFYIPNYYNIKQKMIENKLPKTGM